MRGIRKARLVEGSGNIPFYDIAWGPTSSGASCAGHAKGVIAIGTWPRASWALGGLARGRSRLRTASRPAS